MTREELDNMDISELISSLNDSIEDIRKHPTKIDELPSNLEIMVRGVQDAEGIESLFSPQVDSIINNMFRSIEKMDFSKILENKDTLLFIMDGIFGKGSFRGPVSQTVLNSISATVMSQKYNEVHNHLPKTLNTMRKVNMIMRNLNRNKKNFERGSDEYKKYKEAVYAIKQVLKFAARVYYNRKLINKQVYKGIHNIVHEDYEVDEALI